MMEFKTLQGFMNHLASTASRLPARQVLAMRDAAEIVQVEAKAELGTYQVEAGPFPAWQALADATMLRREEHGFTPNDPLLVTGELRLHIDKSFNPIKAVVGVPSEIVGDGSPGNHARDIGDIAVDMELGTSRAPARPFLGRAAYVKAHDVTRVVAAIMTDAVAGRAYRPHEAKSPLADIPF
jgi:hypothetical protein